MNGKIKVAVIGSGNIGTDLMIKIMRKSDVLEMGALAGADPASKRRECPFRQCARCPSRDRKNAATGS